MSLTQKAYSWYLGTLSIPMILILLILRWKKSRIVTNARLCKLEPSLLFRIRFYQGACFDFLKLLHGNYGRTILARPRDESKLRTLKSSPSLLLSAHFHNWELMGSWLTIVRGIPLLSAAQPLKHPASQFGLEQIRKRTQVPVISRNIPRSALRHLESGKTFGILWDQFSNRGETLAPLFGHLLRMDPLPPFLMLKSRAPVFVGALLPNGHFRIVQIYRGDWNRYPISDPGSVGRQSLNRASADRLARRYHKVLEILIRANPWCWYGLAHRRFKDQVSYEIVGSVSRETPSRTPVLVSRETLT